MKKIVSIALVLLLIVAMVPMAVFADESKATDIANITGKAAGDKITLGGVEYTLIDSADDVVAADGNYYLMNDITLTTYFLADKDNGNNSDSTDGSVFVGKFNGGGHTITLDGAKSVFGKWFGFSESIFANFTLKSKNDAPLNVGAWGSPLGFYASKGGSFYNITNEVDVVAEDGKSNVAGIVGGFSGLAAPALISNCVNKGDITAGSYYSGGVLGAIGNCTGAKVTIENCTNEGKFVYSKDDGTHGYHGGIFGGVPKSTNNLELTITGCKNTGDIESKGCYAGGIMGANYTSTNQTIKIENCENTGAVTANKFAAGILAGNYTGSIALATVKGCVNKGEVSANTAAGGIIAGTGVTASGANFALENCTNNGKVTATNNAGGYVGFINAPAEGESNVKVTVTNCSNTGSVNGGTALSGDPNLVIPEPVTPPAGGNDPVTPPAGGDDPATPPETSDITVFVLAIAVIALAGVCVATKKIRE